MIISGVLQAAWLSAFAAAGTAKLESSESNKNIVIYTELSPHPLPPLLLRLSQYFRSSDDLLGLFTLGKVLNLLGPHRPFGP